jgi:AraC-like DNA-binding protein
MGANIHEYSEILYVKAGCAHVSVDTREFDVPQGHLVFIPPNSIHSYKCQGECVCAVFSRDFIPLFFKELGERVPVPSPIDTSDMSHFLNSLHTYHNNGSSIVSGYLNLICARVIEKSDFCDVKSGDILLFQKICAYISCHYTENITLKEIARELGYNQKYLSSTISALSRINFRTLLASYRINCAKTLINNNDKLSMTEISFKCGFSDISTFNRAFLKMTGKTPTEYKKG